jgi:uncharacterized protein YndB with AHSA1/START domain
MKLVAAFLALASLTGQGYEKVGERDGVTVYRRPDHAIDLAAEGTIDAPPEVVRKVLTDYASHPKWVHGLAVSRVLDRHDSSLDVYQRLDLPMLDDRDFTLHVTWADEGDRRVIRFTTTDKGPEPQKGVVRVPIHEGSWLLEPVDGGQHTRATYQFRMELGGSLPMWMARGRASKDVPALFTAIRKQVPFYR